MNSSIGLAFILLLVLIGVSYYTGLVNDINAVSGLGSSWAGALVGLNPKGGGFAAYPK